MKFMKSNFKIFFLLISMISVGILTGCSDDESGGKPLVRYVRVTKPSASDSLLVAAGQGQMIAVMGENLGEVRQLWINDLPGFLNANLITDQTVITRVPPQIPGVITNKLKMIFANGDSLLYDFAVDINEPEIAYLKSEYVNTGDVIVINGNYFYAPIVVTFTGGVQGTVKLREDTQLEVTVPEGAEPGPITVASAFGETVSDFWFRDDRNIIASFDGTMGGMWKGSDFVVSSDPNITPINGKFVRVNRNLGAWPFLELYGGPKESDVKFETKNIPADALVNPEDYSLKFEINTLKSLTGANMRLYLGNAANAQFDAERQSKYYVWQANLHTNGLWETVSIPWQDVYKATQEFNEDPEGYAMFIYFHGPNALEHNFGLDNIRVVPNTAE
jgi:hypothetical protein